MMPWDAALQRVGTGDQVRSAGVPMDSDAFAQFYERSSYALWAYLTRVSGDPALADDIMQESYVRLLSVTLPETGEVAYRRYLFRVATNLLRDHWKRPRVTSIEEVSEEYFSSSDSQARLDLRALLLPALAQMRPRDRQVLWLAHAEGYSHREIAEITGLGSAGIRLLLFRARRKMADVLRGQPGQERSKP